MTVNGPFPAPLVGTAQHPTAGDLSPYLVHLTRSAESLASILTQGCIEARNPFGLASKNPEHEQTHMAVCFTETPAYELERFSDRKFGVVFKREFVRRLGGQRVWYIDHETPLWNAFQHELNRHKATEPNSKFFQMTPFIDMVRPGAYAFDWEREWRVVGDVKFEWHDIEYLITETEGLLVFDKPSLSNFKIDYREMTRDWSGGTIFELDQTMTRLEEEFRSTFATPDECFLYDQETGDFAWGKDTKRWETSQAVEHLFGERPELVRQVLHAHLAGESCLWINVDDEPHLLLDQ